MEDYANLFLRFKNNIVCNCNLDFINKNYTRKLEIISNKGSFFWDFKKNLIDESIVLTNGIKKKIKTIKFIKEDTYYLSIKYFLNLCKNNEPSANLINAINTLRLVLYAKKAAKLNKSITLKKKDFAI